MKFDALCDRFAGFAFPDEQALERPEKDVVLAARAAMTAAVRDDEFLTDCLGYELTLLERPRRRRQNLVPFFTVPESGIRFAFGYWPPGSNAGAHEHTDWTITSVCRNRLMVHTFDRNESYRRQALVPKNVFDAHAGEVGFIYDPCIHDPHNPTDTWSLSMHVSSPHDGAQPADRERCLPVLDEFAARRISGHGAAYDTVIETRNRQLKIRVIAGVLAGMDVPVTQLLERCVQQGTCATRRFVRGLGGGELTNAESPTVRTTVRVNADLPLHYRETGDSVGLGVETERGWVEELTVSRVAREAIAFCVSTPQFDVQEIPGPLSDEERYAIAEALEETGLFTLATSD